MKTFILSLCLILKGFLSYSECSEWYQGSIHLSDGEVLRGEVQYCLDHDLILLKKKTQTIALSSLQVDHFSIFDQTLKIQRSFYALPFESLDGYKRARFFELLFHGQISLFNREYKKLRVENYFDQPYEVQRWVRADSYYIVDEEGNIQQFSGNKEELLEHMKEKTWSIVSFIDNYKLDVSNRNHLISILDHYDYLQNQSL